MKNCNLPWHMVYVKKYDTKYSEIDIFSVPNWKKRQKIKILLEGNLQFFCFGVVKIQVKIIQKHYDSCLNIFIINLLTFTLNNIFLNPLQTYKSRSLLTQKALSFLRKATPSTPSLISSGENICVIDLNWHNTHMSALAYTYCRFRFCALCIRAPFVLATRHHLSEPISIPSAKHR